MRSRNKPWMNPDMNRCRLAALEAAASFRYLRNSMKIPPEMLGDGKYNSSRMIVLAQLDPNISRS